MCDVDMEKKILVVSSANMDFVMKTDSVPSAGQTLVSDKSYKYVPGGKGANSAVAFSRLGGECVFCTRLGSDANGDTLHALYEREGISTDFIARDPEAPTGLAAILVESNGANRIIVYPGANMNIDEKTVDDAIAVRPNALYMQMEISYSAIIHAAKKASEAKIPIFIDAGPADRDFPFEQLPYLEIFSPNEHETEILTGIYPADEDSCRLAAGALSKLVKAKYFVIKLGARGAYVTDGKREFIAPPFKAEAKDTTAAGDSFTAALTLEYLRTNNIERAARYANAVGAIVVSREGAIPSIPFADEVENFLKA